MIKYEAREFFKDLLTSGFITQLPVQQPKEQKKRTAVLSHRAACEHEAFGLGDQQASDSTSLCVGSQSRRGGFQR